MPIFRSLPCNLTEDDVLDRGKQLANAEYAYEDNDRERRKKNTEMKKGLDAIRGRISELSTAIRDKVETRDVECTICNNWDLMRKELIRSDTGEVVEHYEFTDAERQKSLI